MSFVTDEFSPSFSSVRVTVTCSASTMNAETPRAVRVSRIGAREQEQRAAEATRS